MAKPMPPTVYGPVTSLNPNVRVTGILPGADVTIFGNGTPLGQATSTTPGEIFVPLIKQPVMGQVITAVQKTSSGTSEPSSQPVIVVDVPNPLPTPVILSALNTCISDIYAGKLVPGAQIVASIGGQPFGGNIPGSTEAWLGIDPTKPIPANSKVLIHQEAVIAGVPRVSPAFVSPQIPQFSIRDDLLPAPVLGPLVQCDTARQFQQVVPGATLTITNEGQSELWGNIGESYNGYGGPPLRKGKAVATQSMPRCGRTGHPGTLPVSAAVTPGAPIVTQNLCPQALRLTVSGLVPGGVLHLARRVVHGTGFSESALGDAGIAYETEAFDLPSDVSLTDPGGPVVIALRQERCAGVSPVTRVQLAPVGGPFGPPKIIEPLFDCSSGIPITGTHPGALVQAFDSSSGIPLSDPVGATQATMLLTPWFPLGAGQNVSIRQHGCNADGTSATAIVRPLPQPIPVPAIVKPVRPEAGWIKVTGVLPGARLYLLVGDELRPGSVAIYAPTGVVPVTGPPLQDGQIVFIIQKLCDQSSNTEGRGVRVTRGDVKVSVTPTTIARGTTAMVTVTAADADTATPVSAEVRLNGAHAGVTGVPFAYAPKIGDPNPAGTVHDGLAYADGTFALTLVDPAWTINVRAGPVPAFLDTVRIDITKVAWVVTPDWNASLGKTVTVSPMAPTAAGSATLLRPKGPVKTVTVTISGTCTTAGGNVNGIVVPAQTFALGTNTSKVAFTGSDETIAWLLKVDYVYDPSSDSLAFGVSPYFQGISP